MALARTLKTTSDLKPLAALLRKHGRGKDSVLAHITPQEAALLKARGGRGSINPKTGLPEFDDTSYLPIEVPAPAVDTSVPAPVDTSVAAAPVDVSAAQTTPSFDLSSLFPSLGASTSQADLPATGATESAGFTPATPIDWSQATAPLPSSVTAYAQPAADQLSSGLYDTGTQAQTQTQQPSQGVLADLISGKGLSSTDLSKLLIGGGAGLLGLYGQSQAQAQAAAAQKQIQQAYAKAAQDYEASVAQQRQPASQALSQALEGQFSDQGLRAFQAAEARLAQGAASTGGVGAAQSTAALEAARQSILANQIQMAESILSSTNPAIQAAVQAELSSTIEPVTLGLNLQNQINQASANLYQQIAKMLA